MITFSPKTERSEAEKRSHLAFVLLLLLGAIVGIISAILMIRNPIIINFAGLMAALLCIGGALWARRGRVTAALVLVSCMLYSVTFFIISQRSEIGLSLSLSFTIILMLIASQTLPPRRVVPGVVSLSIVGSIMIVIDLFWPVYRQPTTDFAIRLIMIGSVLMLTIGLVVTIRQFPTYTLRTKLVAAAVSLVILTVLLTTAVVNNITRRNLTEQLNEQFQTVGVAQAAAISELLAREVSVLQAFSLDSTLPSLIRGSELQYAGSEVEIWESINQVNANWIAAPAEGNGLTNRYRNNVTASILQNFQVSFPEHTDMLVTNQYGALIGMSERSPLFDYRNEAWWQAAYNKGEGAIYIGLPEQNPETGTVGIPVAVPVYSGVEFAGVLRTTLQLNQLRELLAETGDLGESIQRELVFGNLVLHDEDEHGAAELHLQSLDVDPDTLLALQNSQSPNLIDTIEGVRSLINLSPISTFGHIPAVDVLDWSIIIHQPEQEALAVVEAQRQASILLALAAIAIGSALAAYFAQLLTGPINRLTDTAVLISGGDLNRQAPVETQDEIGILAQTFNTMTGQLRTFIGSLESRVADRTQALATSTEVSRRLSTILDLDELVNEVVNQTRDAFHYYHAQIYLFDASKLYLLMAGGTGEAGQEMLAAGHKLRINQGVVGRSAATNQVVLIPDVAQDSNWLPNPLLPDTKAEAAIPIKLGDEVLGVLDVQHNVTNGLNEESVALLQSIANQVAVAIQNAQQLEQTNLQYELATELTQASQPDQILEAVSSYGRRLGASSAQLLFFENNEVGYPEWAVVRAAWHTEEGGIPVGTRYFLPDFGFAPLWLSSPERPLLIPDTATHEAVGRELRKLYAQINILATAVLPLYAQGRWAGLVLFNWNMPHAFTSRDERIFTNLAQQTFSVVETVQSAQRIQDALQEAEQLYQVSQRLSHATTLEASLVAALQTAIDANAANASLLTFELDQTGQPIWAEVAAAWSRDQMVMPLHTRFYLPDFPMSKLWLSDADNPLFISDIEVDERVDATTKMLYKQGGTISSAILPLTVAGRWVGLAVIIWGTQREFVAQEKRVYRAIMGQLASVVDRTRQFERGELLSSIVDNHPDFIGVSTLEGKALYVNPSGLKLLGYAPDQEVSEMDVANFYTPIDAQRLLQEGVPTAMQSGGWADEVTFITASGAAIPVEETIGINYDVDNHATSFSMTVRDISERKAAEEAIRTSQQLALSFQEKLTMLQEITTELSQLETLIDLTRKAIEMGHGRLGLDRLSIWLFDEQLTVMQGTFGTSSEGVIIDETDLLHPMSEYGEWFTDILHSRERRIVRESVDLYEGYDVAGQGWHVTALLMQEDRPLGYVAVDNLLNQRPLQPFEPDLITLFANTVASLVVNKQVQQAVTKQAQELQTVADLSRIATTILDVNELLQQVCDLTKERFNLYHAHIYLVSDDEQYLTLTNGAGDVGQQMAAEGRQISLRQKQSLVARAARSGQGVIANDVQAEPGFLPHPLLPETRSELAMPLIAGEQVLGVLDIQSNEINYFTETDINIQSTLAAQIATAIQNARQYQRTQEALDELTRMQHMLIRDGWESFLTGRNVELQGYRYDQREIHPIKRNGQAETAAVPDTAVPDTAVHSPLTVRGATIGVLGVRDPSGQPIAADKQLLLASISQQVAEALERARLFEESEISRQRLDARARQLATINRVAAVVAQQLQPEQLLEAVYEEVRQIISADIFYVSFYHEDSNTLEIPVNYEDGRRMEVVAVPVTPESKSYQVIQTGERLHLNLTPKQVQELQQQVVENKATTIMGDLEKPPTATQLFVPLLTGQRVTGILSVQSYAHNAFSEDDVEMITGIASYVAVGLENGRLFSQIQERAEELTLINEVAQVVSQQLDIELVLSTVHDRVSQVMSVDAFSVSQYDAQTNILEYLFVYDSGEFHQQSPAPLQKESMSYQVITSGLPALRNYTPEEHTALQATSPTVGLAKLPPSIIFAPLLIGSKSGGVISVQSYEYNAYTENDLTLLMGIANHMAVALENARLFAETQQALAETQKRTEELATVNRIVSQLGSLLDVQQAMQVVAQGLVDGIGIHQARIALLDSAKENLIIVAEAYDTEQNESVIGLHIPVIGNELTLEVIRTRQGVVVTDVDNNPLTAPVREMLAEQHVKMLAVLPMLVGNEVIGTVGMDILGDGQTITEDMKRLAETIIYQAAAAIQNARLFTQTEEALQEVQKLFGISAQLNAATTLDGAVAAASAQALADGAVSGTLFKFELDAAGEPAMVELVASTNPNPVIPVGTRFTLEDMPSAQLRLATGEGILLVEDVAQETQLDSAFKLSLEQSGTKACVFMTLSVGNRQLGSILIRWSEPHLFSEADRRLYYSIATQTASVIDSILLLDEVQSRATELQETTGFLDSIVENLPVMVFVKDAQDLRFVRWNKAGSEITGYPQEDFIGKNDFDFFTEEEAQYFVAKDREVLNNRVTVDIPDEPIQTLHQGIRTLHTRKVPILDAEGKPKYLLGISEDITERRQFEEALAKRALELQMVAEISTAVASTLDASRLLQDVVDLTRDNFDLYHTHIYLMNEAQNALVLAAGAGQAGAEMVAAGHSIPLENERLLVVRAARSRQGVIANDVQADEDFLPNELLPDTRSEMAVPLMSGNQVLGVLDVQSNRVNHFTTQDINIQSTLASQVATALQNARLFNQTEERAAELATINAITEVASSQLNLTSLVEQVGPLLQKTFHTETAYIALYDSASRMITFPYYHTYEEGRVVQPDRQLGENSGFTGQIIENRQPISFVPDAESFTAMTKEMGGRVTGSGKEVPTSYLGVPIVVGDAVIGVIGLNSHDEVHILTGDDQRLLTTLASTIGVAIQNAQQFEVTRRRAERERIVNEITQKIQGSLSMESALQTAVKELGHALGAKFTQVELKLGHDDGDSNGTTL